MRPSRTPARSSRLAGATGALLLQGGFLLLFLASMPILRPPPQIERELSLSLPRFVLPPRPQVRGQGLPGPVTVTPPLPLPPNALAPRAQIIPPPALTGVPGFGQALNGCAPEKYASLPPDLKAHCPKPGDGVARNQDEIQLSPNLHIKGLAALQEQWDEKHWMPGLCDPSMESIVALCLANQSIAEAERAADVHWHLARDHDTALKPPPTKIPDGARASAAESARPER